MGREAVIAGSVGLSRRRAPPSLACLALWILLATSVGAFGQPANGADAGSAANSEAFSTFGAILSEKYPGVRALVVARGACVVFEYYRKDVGVGTRSPVYSVTKSVLSILIGMAIDRGYLRLDEKLSELLPEASEGNVDPLVREIEVRDLLTMTAGFAPNADGGAEPTAGAATPKPWRSLLDRPIRYPPGSRFDYDTSDQNLLSIVLTRAIKQDAQRFARRNLFDPMQIENYRWSVDLDGHLIGATSLFLTARDMAKIGVLYLRQGRWGDDQIVSKAFVRNSTTRKNSGGLPVNAAYGYLWWIGKTKAGADVFFAAGQNDQLIYVDPELELVVALAAESIPGGAMSLVNDVVLPAEAGLPASAPCVTRFTPGRAE